MTNTDEHLNDLSDHNMRNEHLYTRVDKKKQIAPYNSGNIANSYPCKSIKQSFVIIISDSTSILHFTEHVSDCCPRNSLDR